MSNTAPFLTHPAFQDAIADIQSLGLKVSPYPSADAIPYAVIGGRSNARWWLLPLENRQVTSSGLALFQPILTSARWIKRAVVLLSKLGMGWLWAKPQLYISGQSVLASYFNSNDLSYAYFTGTDSPHRKIAVQIMNKQGAIKGFAKVSRNPEVKKFINHEAKILQQLATLDIKTAYLPAVLYIGEQHGASVLLTDTLKTPNTPTVSKLKPQHLAFLQELAQKTVTPQPPSQTIEVLHKRYTSVASQLTAAWCTRLEHALTLLNHHTHQLLSPTLIHGDFTPWNTFFVDQQLYVFDWEYAEFNYPTTNDFIHFLLAQPDSNQLTAELKLQKLVTALAKDFAVTQSQQAILLVALYLTSHTLQYVERNVVSGQSATAWDSANSTAELLDLTLALHDR